MKTKTPDLDSEGRDRNDYPRCKGCGASCLDVDLSLEPTMSTLVFGPFPKMHANMEYRCNKCEAKVSKTIGEMLKAI
jgi:DNA-directed RNA polymerase subunit RPC12/RpoP